MDSSRIYSNFEPQKSLKERRGETERGAEGHREKGGENVSNETDIRYWIIVHC